MDKIGWTPEQLEQELKKKIIGQDKYLHDLSVCLWLHNQRREHFLRTGEIISEAKYNMLVLGKSGMGKTSAISAAAKLLDIPLVIEDASELRGAGWKGKQVSEIINDVVETAIEGDYSRRGAAEFSIVVLDEIDKVFGGRNTDGTFLPISNLLKFIEGTEVSYGRGPDRVCMRTDNILFIAIGAFDGIEEIIEKRVSPKSIGFANTEKNETSIKHNILKEVTVEDFVAYGVNEQFLGRLPFMSIMNELEEEDYKNIILKSEISPIRQLSYLLKKEQDASISVTDYAAEKLAYKIKTSGLGARALHGEVVNLFKETMYSLANDTEHIEYILDYENDFYIKKVPGERGNYTEIKRKDSFALTKTEQEKLWMVKLDTIPENEESVRLYAEQMFDQFEMKNYGEYSEQGLADFYDYMTIKRAKLLAATAIAEVFLDANSSGTSKNMLTLLNTLRKLSLDRGGSGWKPLERIKDDLLTKMKSCTDEDVDKIKEIAWQVVKKYAFIIYKLDFGEYDDSAEG